MYDPDKTYMSGGRIVMGHQLNATQRLNKVVITVLEQKYKEALLARKTNPPNRIRTNKMKTVPEQHVSRLRMVSGNENKYPVVIDNGKVKEWVGIGWCILRDATEGDLETYPTITGDKNIEKQNKTKNA